MRPLSVNRIRTISFALGAFFLVLISRSAYLMLLPNEKLSAQASQQLLETKVISGRRGDIYDRNKNLLASSVSLCGAFDLAWLVIAWLQLLQGRCTQHSQT